MTLRKVFFVIGVSGVGKSTVGKILSKNLNIPFFDGDDIHSNHNLLKMSRGKALDDKDRAGWLKNLNKLAINNLENGCVIACSALKEIYREKLVEGIDNESRFIFLNGSYELIKDRLDNREDHFMSSDLLQSQFDTLEIPSDAIEIDVNNPLVVIIEEIQKRVMKKTKKAEFGLFGLGVMGKSLSRNLARNGFVISLFNRHVSGKEENVAKTFRDEFDELESSLAFDNISEFVNSLEQPRKIMLMVNSGSITDSVIEDLLPFLDEGDILIDGGNSNYNNTKDRYEYLANKKINFVGTGVSGGERGALHGPSIMPGCTKEMYDHISPYLETIAARDANQLPCCTHVGIEGSGHFVKMIHNGIEYVEMQLLSEVYHILKSQSNNPDEIADILEEWKKDANSYLLEITIDILRKKEGDDWLLNKIMDKAGNKGTGNWATISSAQLGVPSTMIASALFARYTSFYKEERVAISKFFVVKPNSKLDLTNKDVLNAYKFARLINHYQGFKLIKEASDHYKWDLNLSELSRIWTNGCIIRSDLMVELVTVFNNSNNLLENIKSIQKLGELRPAIKKVVSQCILNDVPIPNLSESINFLNSFVIADSSANLIQAQRDYFGAHTYQRKDDASQKSYHTEWDTNTN